MTRSSKTVPSAFLTLSLLGGSLALTGCQHIQSNSDAAAFASAPGVYTLDTGDRVRVNVFGQPDLSNTYLVSDIGHISMPLIGSVSARGKTTDELDGAVTASLKKKYIKDADVTVEVDTYRPFFIMGEVGASGQYSYVVGMSAQTAVAIAGGFSERANKSHVAISRMVGGEKKTAIVPLHTPVRPGDTVTVLERVL